MISQQEPSLHSMFFELISFYYQSLFDNILISCHKKISLSLKHLLDSHPRGYKMWWLPKLFFLHNKSSYYLCIPWHSFYHLTFSSPVFYGCKSICTVFKNKRPLKRLNSRNKSNDKLENKQIENRESIEILCSMSKRGSFDSSTGHNRTIIFRTSLFKEWGSLTE